MSSNKLTIDSYSKDIAAVATAEDIVADAGVKWKFAKDVILKAPAGNTSDILVGNRTRQAFPLLAAGDELRLSSILNLMSASSKYDLSEIFVKAGTNGDDIHILLIDPSMD